MDSKVTERTIEYYNQNADEFIERTINSDMSNCYRMFLKYMNHGQSILHLGCGSGRDSKYFMDEGFDVTSIDGSVELCKQASIYLGKEVICKRFEDMNHDNQFDGIWASACLLHVKREDLTGILRKLSYALKINGYLYASFKYGEGERVAGERYFHDYMEKDIELLFNEDSRLQCIEWYVTDDVRNDRTHERWINMIARKV